MGWTLHYQPIRNARANDAMLTLGRALFVSNAFEDKCRYVLRVANLVDKIESDPVADFADLVAQLPTDKMLGLTLSELDQKLPGGGDQVVILVAARKARNYIAHESGLFGIHNASTVRLAERVERLREVVRDLARGDNIVSKWVFEITEGRTPLPSALIDAYESVLDSWVFAPVWDLLKHPVGTKRPPIDGRLHR